MSASNFNRRSALARLGAMGLGAATLRATAQNAPSKPVRLVTAFPPGSGPDAALRLVADQLGKMWKQTTLVENRPGGNGFIAYDAFKSAAPDGQTLIQLDSNHLTTHPHLFSKLPWDPTRDLEPVSPLFRNYFFVVVAASSPYKTLDDLIQAARNKPGQVNYGSWFNGSPGHLGALRLSGMAGLDMVHVPYKEISQLYAAVATREVDWALGSAASAGALEKAGKLRFIAVAGPRTSAYPGVPSASESQWAKGFEAAAWTGLFAPRGTPAAIKERLHADIARALGQADVVDRYKTFVYERFDADPRAFAAQIAAETLAWGEVIRKAGLKLDNA